MLRNDLFPSPAPVPQKDLSQRTSMDRPEITIRKILTAVEAPLYDIGVLSDSSMLPQSRWHPRRAGA